jgi:hypothetical protein
LFFTNLGPTWLLDQRLIGEDAASQFLTDHPDPTLP